MAMTPQSLEDRLRNDGEDPGFVVAEEHVEAPPEPAKRSNKTVPPAQLPAVRPGPINWKARARYDLIQRETAQQLAKVKLLVQCLKKGQVAQQIEVTPNGDVFVKLLCLVNSAGSLQAEHVATITP